MANLDLTQEEADLLIAMEKHSAMNEALYFPLAGSSLTVPLQSADRREQFILDISLSGINLLKGKYQNRARQMIVLVRLDFGGAPHRNPDGEEIPSPHLHLYREGYGDKWAKSIPVDQFPRMTNLFDTLEDFMKYCNITQPPNINPRLF